MALSPEDHAAVAAAIGKAEATTSGEIFCVFTEASDDLTVVPLAYAALAALVLPPLLLWFGVFDPTWFGEWRTTSTITVHEVVTVHVALSALLFAGVWLLLQWRPLRFAMAPKSLKRANADRAAMESFLSHGIHTTEERTGVLIFLSRAEHVAEVVADEGINAKVGEEVWGDIVEAMLAEARQGNLAAAFVRAVERAGAVLTEHFPPRPGNPNELPDKLIEL